MHRGLVVVFGMVASVWQVGAHAATDWDAKLRADFQGLVPAPPIAALSTTTRAAPLRRDMTILLVQARRHRDELSSDTQVLAKPWLQRPVGATDPQEVQWSFKNPETTVDSPSGRYKIHYIDKAKYPSDANAAVASWVTVVAAVLDNVANVEHGTLGYAAVPSDGVVGGGVDMFDVYLTNLLPYGLYGYVSDDVATSDSTRPYGAASYMVLDNDFLGYGYADAHFPLEVTAAHEYFHAVQNGYSRQEDVAFMEQTATWMEDIVYPAIHDNYSYIGEPYEDTNGNGQYDKGVDGFTDRNHNGQRDEGSLEYPEVPLNAFNTPPSVQYGRFLWPRYLSEKFDNGVLMNGIVKTIWEQCGQVAGDNTFSAMDSALQAKGWSLATAYHEYASWGYDKSKYIDGANYPLVWVDRSVNGMNLALSSAGSPSLVGTLGQQQYLSTVYTQILNPTGSYTFTSLGGDALVTMLIDTGVGALTYQPVTISNGAGQWVAPTGATKAIAVVSNVASSINNMGWSFITTGMTVTTGVPRLDSIVSSTGQVTSWQSGNVTVHGIVNTSLTFKIVATSSAGDVPSISILSNPTNGTYSAKTGYFTWAMPTAAGTYTVQVAAYAIGDVSNSTSGTITIVIDSATSVTSSHKKKFLGSVDLAMLLLLVGYGVRRRLSNNCH
jgi:hypothetical protein